MLNIHTSALLPASKDELNYELRILWESEKKKIEWEWWRGSKYKQMLAACERSNDYTYLVYNTFNNYHYFKPIQ